jgi:hypothetical protein
MSHQNVCFQVTGFLIAGELIKGRRTLSTQPIPCQLLLSTSQLISPHLPTSSFPFIIDSISFPPFCQGFTKSHSGRVRTDSDCRDLKNILTAIPPQTTSDLSWEASAW